VNHSPRLTKHPDHTQHCHTYIACPPCSKLPRAARRPRQYWPTGTNRTAHTTSRGRRREAEGRGEIAPDRTLSINVADPRATTKSVVR